MRRSILLTLLLLLGALAEPSLAVQACPASGIALQILGSNGPRISANRASSSYVIWIDGRSRILVDAGGGAFLRFGEAGARIEDLALIAISHLHPDHVSDLPALLWGDFLRKTVLPIAGPSGNADVPEFRSFLHQLFDPKSGAFRMLGSTLGGTGRVAPLEITVADTNSSTPSTVLERDGLVVTAFGVPHGNIPALAYRVQAGKRAVVFGTDQTGTDPRFAGFAANADLLVLHMTVAVGTKSPLHAAPDVVGQVARDAKPARLILSHFDHPPDRLDAAVAEVKQHFAGPITVGADLQCTPLP